jgi:hypothetical protein
MLWDGLYLRARRLTTSGGEASIIGARAASCRCQRRYSQRHVRGVAFADRQRFSAKRRHGRRAGKRDLAALSYRPDAQAYDGAICRSDTRYSVTVHQDQGLGERARSPGRSDASRASRLAQNVFPNF